MPFHARPVGRAARWKAGLDFFAHNLPQAHSILVKLNPYPKPWRHVHLTMPDGAKLAAWYGPGKPGAGALIMVPGTFQTKDDTPRKRRAIDLHRRFGLHVLILDLRGFGGSHASVGTAGREEAQDLHVAADWLRREAQALRVELWGESLGGAVALLAACEEGADARFARVVAWSPFADLEVASSAEFPPALQRAYRFLLRRRDKSLHDFRSFLELRAAQLGMTVDDLVHAGSPARHVHNLRVPGLVFHAEDDPVVPVNHAHLLADAAPDHLNVHIVPAGEHLDFDLVAPEWYRRVTERLFAKSA